MSQRIDTFTICQPGLEPVLAGELSRLGVAGRVTHGGVIASMTWSQLAQAHLHLRTATRLLVRIARFDAVGFSDLVAGLRRIDWAAWLPRGARTTISVATTASRLYHTGAIEQRVREVVPSGDGAEQRISIRIDHDLVTVSIDASGEPLYQRGWRTETVAAPLRETLAAALVLWSGWDAKRPLVDPCAGSGTVAIEAAMWARRMAPGRHREFAFCSWEAAAGVDLDRLRAAADADVRPNNVVVAASDIDPVAVEVTTLNAQRAGVDIMTSVVDVAERANQARGARPGWVITNPPYGVRLGGDLRRIYAAVGRLASPPWHLAVVAAMGTPSSAFDRQWESSLATRNGGVPVRFLRA